ncbi:MAG: flagellar hook-length control protein FliK [Bdellovibrionota bacterium]|jgi:flagellar hook-length control protein FliK
MTVGIEVNAQFDMQIQQPAFAADAETKKKSNKELMDEFSSLLDKIALQVAGIGCGEIEKGVKIEGITKKQNKKQKVKDPDKNSKSITTVETPQKNVAKKDNAEKVPSKEDESKDQTLNATPEKDVKLEGDVVAAPVTEDMPVKEVVAKESSEDIEESLTPETAAILPDEEGVAILDKSVATISDETAVIPSDGADIPLTAAPLKTDQEAVVKESSEDIEESLTPETAAILPDEEGVAILDKSVATISDETAVIPSDGADIPLTAAPLKTDQEAVVKEETLKENLDEPLDFGEYPMEDLSEGEVLDQKITNVASEDIVKSIEEEVVKVSTPKTVSAEVIAEEDVELDPQQTFKNTKTEEDLIAKILQDKVENVSDVSEYSTPDIASDTQVNIFSSYGQIWQSQYLSNANLSAAEVISESVAVATQQATQNTTVQGVSAVVSDAADNNTQTNRDSENTKNTKMLTRSQTSSMLARVEDALKEISRSKDGKTISIKLDPEELGTLKVDVTLRDGNLHARLVADNAAVNQALRERAPELQQILRNLGINVDQVSVSVASDEGTFEGTMQQQTQQDKGERDPLAASKRENSEAPASTRKVKTLDSNDHWIA